MSQPTIALPTHRIPTRQPASSWYERYLKLQTILEERRSNSNTQDQEIGELVCQQNTEAIRTHAQSINPIVEQIRLQVSSRECSDNNTEDIFMNLVRLERRVDLILQICEDDQAIRNFRDHEKHYREMADQKITTMTSLRPTSPPHSFPQPQQPKDRAEESEASDSEQGQGGSDAISGGKQKDGEAGYLDTDSVQEYTLFDQEYHKGSVNYGFTLVSPESNT